MSTDNLLEAWLAQEREVLARLEAGPGPGLASPEQVAGKTGLEIMEAILASGESRESVAVNGTVDQPPLLQDDEAASLLA